MLEENLIHFASRSIILKCIIWQELGAILLAVGHFTSLSHQQYILIHQKMLNGQALFPLQPGSVQSEREQCPPLWCCSCLYKKQTRDTEAVDQQKASNCQQRQHFSNNIQTDQAVLKAVAADTLTKACVLIRYLFLGSLLSYSEGNFSEKGVFVPL